MAFFKGIQYNLRGLRLGLRTPELLFLGILRFLIVIIVAVACIMAVLAYHQDLTNALWSKPESLWVLWLWHLVSWLISLILIGLSTLFSYLLSQICFGVLIMDIMSQRTERMITGKVFQNTNAGWVMQFLFLIRQEIPRTFFPILVALLILVLGWLTPLGPVLAVISTAVTILFLAWDNTDLIPARQLKPFNERLRLLTGNIAFHLGFGILFLVPVANILFLSFAPVGAAMFHCEKHG